MNSVFASRGRLLAGMMGRGGGDSWRYDSCSLLAAVMPPGPDVPPDRVAAASIIYQTEEDCFCCQPCGSFIRQLAAQLVDPSGRMDPAALQVVNP
jgi:hypothetical protein